MTSLILCGGSGTRLWPLSRSAMPKQYVPLVGGESLFEAALRRNADLSDKIALAAGASHVGIAEALMKGRGLCADICVVEAVGRNTAPAIALVAMALDPGELILVSPSDHYIQDEVAYKKAVKSGQDAAARGRLVCLGVRPSYAETGYGYIKHKDGEVLSFVEKPGLELATEFLTSGKYLWNAGIFCFQAGVFLRELELHCPEVFRQCRKVAFANRSGGRIEASRQEMEAIPAISVDKAVMEKSDKVSVVPCDMGWSDLGSFDALYMIADKDGEENASVGGVTARFSNSKRNLAIGPAGKRIMMLGMEDCVVVDSPDALLIMARGSGQRVRDLVDTLIREDPGIL